MKYKVKGHVSVINQTETIVEADSPEEAIAKSRVQLGKRGALRDALVPRSEDEASAFDYEPLCAEPTP